MGLNAKAPPRVLDTIADSPLRVRRQVGAVHGLKKEVIESEMVETLRPSTFLWIDQL